jgi:anterior pharynx defective protein 1
VAQEAEHAGASLTVADHFSLSLTHGLAHASVHSLFFFVSWLPLCLGNGTIYYQQCPQMSYFLVSTLSTLGFAGLLTGGMVVAFDGLERRNYRQAAVPSSAHLAAACLMLANFAQGGCVVSTPLLLVSGAAMAGWAGRLWWLRTDDALPPATTPPAAGSGAVDLHHD